MRLHKLKLELDLFLGCLLVEERLEINYYVIQAKEGRIQPQFLLLDL